MRRFTLILALALAATLPSAAADRGDTKEAFILPGDSVIPQIATGGGSLFMTFQFVGITDTAATVTLSFFDGAGDPMAIPYMQDGQEIVSDTLTETVAPGGFEVARTVIGAESVQVGYARVSSAPENSVAVSVAFNQVVPGRPLFQAFIPLDTVLHNRFFVPALNTGGFTGSMAIVSLIQQDVTFIARNNNGVELCREARKFAAGQHTAFLFRDRLACTAGVDTVIEVVGSEDFGLAGFGLTAEDSGAFVTQPVFGPEIPLLL